MHASTRGKQRQRFKIHHQSLNHLKESHYPCIFLHYHLNPLKQVKLSCFKVKLAHDTVNILIPGFSWYSDSWHLCRQYTSMNEIAIHYNLKRPALPPHSHGLRLVPQHWHISLLSTHDYCLTGRWPFCQHNRPFCPWLVRRVWVPDNCQQVCAVKMSTTVQRPMIN